MPTEPVLKMLPGMMPILHSLGVSTPGQLGPISRDLEPVERALHLDHVEHRDALGDADDQRELGVDGLEDGVGGERRRHVDDGGGGAGLGLPPPSTVSKIGSVSRACGSACLVPPLPGVDAADDLGAG